MTGLQKQHILIALGQGVDTKTDPKIVAPGKLAELKNGVFKKRGRIDKRPGYEVVTSQTVTSASLVGGSALQTFNDELLQYNKQRLYSFSEGAGKWIDKGVAVSASVESQQVVKNTASQTQADFAYTGGISVYAYEDSRGGVRASVYDEVTGTTLIADTEVASSGTRVRCCAFNGYLFVFYYNSGNLLVRRINPLLPTSFDSPVTAASDVNTTNPHYDVLPFQDLRIAFVYNVQGATEIKFGWLSVTPAVLTGTLGVQTISEAATNSLAVILGPSNLFYVAWHNASGLRCSIRNNGGNQLVAATTVDSYTATTICNITGFPARDGSGLTFFYEVTAASAYNQFIKKNTLTTSGSAGTASVFLRSVGLYSKAFSYYFASETTDHAYVCITHASTLQNTYFIARDDGIIVGKMQYTTGTGLTTRTILANVAHPDSNTFLFAITNKLQLISENDNVFSLQGVSRAKIDFNAAEQFNALQLGDNLHIVGGVLSMYDGQSVVEHGFHLYPEDLSYALSGGAGSIVDGNYSYVAMYEWTDNFGQIHRSAPSVELLVTVSGGPKNVLVTIPTLRLTQKTSPRSEISIVLYRSEVGPGSIYYRVSSVTSPTYNSLSADTVTITDSLTDAQIVSRELLYSTGGVVENFPPPSCKYIEQFKDRIFLAGLENPSEIWYSKIRNSGEPVEFSPFLTLDASSEGGGIEGAAVLDDKFVLFKRDRLFMTYGDGPNNAGTGGEFAKPQFITADVGCDNANSIVRTPDGLMFKSSKGIYSLDRALNVAYIGADVETYNSETITSATLMADVNQVRFTTRSGPLIVYDYYMRQWGTFTPYSAADSLIWNKQFVFLSSAGAVYKENTSFRDNGAGISLSLTTGWIALDSIIGLQRVYKLLIIGQYKSYHKLRVSVGYDFSESFEHTYVMDTDSAFAVTTFGSQSPFGSESPMGGDSNVYRFVVNLTRQKCQAIKFKIEDLTVASTPGTGEGYNITGIGLLAGIKGQAGKFKASQKIAST